MEDTAIPYELPEVENHSFFFNSLDNRIAQKFGPHMVQYSPSIWCPARK